MGGSCEAITSGNLIASGSSDVPGVTAGFGPDQLLVDSKGVHDTLYIWIKVRVFGNK